MRKGINVVIILLMFMFIVSCGSSDELTNFSAAFKGYDYSKTAGHRYTKIQRLDGVIIYEESLDMKINRDTPIMAHKYYLKKDLNEFSLDSQFTETHYNEYYYKDSIGTENEDNITWVKKAFSEFSESITLPKLKFKKSYLSEHTLTKLADYLLLKADIKDEYTKEFFGIDENISNVYIEVRIKGKKLQEFKIVYKLELTTVETSYRVYYDKHELSVKYE